MSGGNYDAATITISIIAILISFVTYRILKSRGPILPSNDACGDNLTACDVERISHSAVIITEGQRNVTR